MPTSPVTAPPISDRPLYRVRSRVIHGQPSYAQPLCETPNTTVPPCFDGGGSVYAFVDLMRNAERTSHCAKVGGYTPRDSRLWILQQLGQRAPCCAWTRRS